MLSTAYLPNIEYFAILLKYKNIIIEQEETYPKQTYRNRGVILSANGKLDLSIPVKKVYGNNTKTKVIQIINSNLWYTNHWRAISSAYSNSPFFLFYKDELEIFFKGKFNNLLDFNTKLTNELVNIIGANCKITYSKSFTKPNTIKNDFRFSVNPKNNSTIKNFKSYNQVFSNKYDFIPNLSIIDLLFNLGPEAKDYLDELI